MQVIFFILTGSRLQPGLCFFWHLIRIFKVELIMKKIVKWVIAFVLVLGSIFLTLYFIYFKPFIDKIKTEHRVTLDSQAFVFTGGGGNSGLILCDSLALVIDTKIAGFEKPFYDTIIKKKKNRALLVINTHWHPDHVAGNYLFSKADILAGANYKKDDWIKEAGEKNLPGRWLKDTMLVPLGTDTAIIFNLAKNVHTASDVMVYLKSRKLLFAGDIVLNEQAPALFGVADADAYVSTMRELLKRFDIKTIVPGHGAVGGKELVLKYIEYFEDMKMAAVQPDKEGILKEKYKNWNQIPFAMSPGATISHFKNKSH